MSDDRSDRENEFGAVLERLRQHQPDAIEELINGYGDTILKVIRSKMPRRLRTLYDSDDFVQVVWTEFLTKSVLEQTFETPEQLMGYIIGLARNQVLCVARQRLDRQKYDMHRDQSLEGLAPDEADRLAEGGPSPEQRAIAREEWARLLRGQPEHARQILVLLGAGHTYAEVARLMGISEKTVQRVVCFARMRADGHRP
jgi:RNA polymerase sigma factor (sigma-70 family)